MSINRTNTTNSETSEEQHAVKLPLLCDTPQEWVEAVFQDFDHFLVDHTLCERKASALAMSFVAKYPDRTHLVHAMISLAREELEHFHQMYFILNRRNLPLGNDTEDRYVNELLKFCRHGREERLLDRLLTSGVIEARGAERFMLIADALQEKADVNGEEYQELATFYKRIALTERAHFRVFFKIAATYFAEDVIQNRLNEILESEKEIMQKLPARSALY